MAMSPAAMDPLRRRAPGKALGSAEREDDDPPGSAGFRGAPSDIDIHAREVLSVHAPDGGDHRARTPNREVEQVMLDIDRDKFMSPARRSTTADRLTPRMARRASPATRVLRLRYGVARMSPTRRAPTFGGHRLWDGPQSLRGRLPAALVS
jgi:hypothetical protein